MAAKRIGHPPSPTDLGYKLIDAKMKQMLALRELADTDEFRGVANAVAQISLYDATPTITTMEDGAYWSFTTYPSVLHSWDDPRLTTLLSALQALDPDEQDIKDFPEYNKRDHTMEWKFEDNYSIRLKIVTYLSKTAPVLDLEAL